MICDLIRRANVVSWLLIAASLAVPTSALAQSLAGNPLLGRQVATTICASCHQVVSEEKPTRPQSPPSFLDIAKTASTTALSLKVFLRSNHMEMPNLIISNSDTDDVIAYILSLKEPPASRQ
jgi:mono/diheme cytochrome c family protein